MQRRRIVVNMWGDGGVITVRRLGPAQPDPTAAELAAVAARYTWANGGVRPSARVLEDATIYRVPGPWPAPFDPSGWP